MVPNAAAPSVSCSSPPAAAISDLLAVMACSEQVCQNTTEDKLSKEPVWIRATMMDDYFPKPSTYNTSLGVLYFTGELFTAAAAVAAP